MTPRGQIYLSSARSRRNTANYCRRVAIENEAKQRGELARKWWDHYWEYRAKAWGNIATAKQERLAS
ncbi:hypothetical protein [Falsochrobactrum shanghaiense]|uniref:hypothetical protein n=1 Tax=Falsochrobactrum shanghaiense TaxID=2201899 RepID=UPI0011B1CE06|nr:hypothetical protein [Falsochrobactrum shanghaiense]